MSELDPYFFEKSVLNMSGAFEVSGTSFSSEEVLSAIEPILTDDRIQRIDQVLENRTLNVVPVMENIYDRGNISAVMRSAEAFGFLRCHVIEDRKSKFKTSRRVTKGADKWLDTRVFTNAKDSVAELKDQGYQVYATSLEASVSLDTIDFTKKTAIVFGNEKAGVSKKMQSLCDGNVIIPMQGFSQSFNISVAAALIFYHAAFQRRHKMPRQGGDLSDEEKQMVKANYYLRCIDNPEGILLRSKMN